MASAESIRVNNLVPIVLLLGDGNPNVYPQALIKNEDHLLLETIDLVYEGNGLYAPADIDKYYMPETKSISVSFIVFEDIGHALICDKYEYDIDVFEKELIALQIGDDLKVDIELESINIDIEIEQELNISVEVM